MAKKQTAGLVKKPRYVTRRFDLKHTTAAAADALTERLKRDAPELSFDFDAVVDEALTERITQANQELDQRAAGVTS